MPEPTHESTAAEREAKLAAREAEAAQSGAKHGLLDNGDPNFKNAKEKIYDRFLLTVHQLDIIIGVLFALLILFIILGVSHISFFGLF